MRVQARDNANIKKEAFDVFSCILIMPQPTRLPLPAIARFPTSIDPQFLFSLSQAASRSSQQRCQIIALHSAHAVRLRVRRPRSPSQCSPRPHSRAWIHGQPPRRVTRLDSIRPLPSFHIGPTNSPADYYPQHKGYLASCMDHGPLQLVPSCPGSARSLT